ncbi:hypothetical protein [Agrobacterium rosae]|uniref:Uncharacterized protein n=1 Tax=Agrobacterium rosae TaxID=1972867 RepID=A0AAW9FT47_9HYPH|nr:hypothetical protein [Agrobacterium rosae]MDX8305709.1 hypothetical protein [Agrobacterium rosae]
MAVRCADETLLLLPGDRAPALELAIPINRKDIDGIKFDRTSIVVLWNAGCSGCFPVLKHLPQLDEEFGASSYGVAIMVRDIETTLSLGRSISTATLLAIEDAYERTGLSRGRVTKTWFEASGHQALPAAFIVSADGILLWTGHPDAVEDVLREIRDGEWDVAVARERRRLEISSAGTGYRFVINDITDALMANDPSRALQLVHTAENQFPAILTDGDFNLTKLQVLVSNRAGNDAILAHYAATLTRIQDEHELRVRFAAEIIGYSAPSPAIVKVALRDLLDIEAASFDGLSLRGIVELNLSLARAFSAEGQQQEAAARLAKLKATIANSNLPTHIAEEIEIMAQSVLLPPG